MQRSALAHIHLAALQHNLSIVKSYAPNSKVMCAVKANAYGHGLIETAQALQAADGFAVADLSEALALRHAGIVQTLLVLQGPQSKDDIALFEEHNISTVIHHAFQVPLLEHANISVWIKVNTGMNRLGFLPDEVEGVLKTIGHYKQLRLEGLFSHMADADFADSRGTTDAQLALLNKINNKRYPLSTANSASLLHWPQSQQDWVRPGIILYGVNPFIDSSKTDADLQAAMTLSAPIIAINTCLKGQKVGYAGKWQAERDSKIAVVAIGYGDGYPRHAKNGTPVLINGKTYPLVGRVSMDLLTVDITDADNIHLFDHAVLWGEQQWQGKKVVLAVEKVAECADTIAYELLCAVYGRVNYNYN